MAKQAVANEFSVQRLEFMSPPLPSTGGRLAMSSGELAQILSGEPMRLITYIEFKSDGQPRGNHFHRKKTEIIYVIKGKLRLTIESLEDHSHQTITLQAGDLVRIQPNCAHLYVAEQYTQAIEMNSVPYDPADTFPYAVKTSSSYNRE